MTREKRKTMGLAIGVAVSFLALAFSPLTSPHYLQNASGELGGRDSIEVVCQIFVGGEIERVVGEMTRERFVGITALARELSADFREKPLHPSVRQKITALLGELKDAGLLPRTKEVGKVADMLVNRWASSQRFLRVVNNLYSNDKTDDDLKANYFNFIFGVGKHTYTVKLLTEMVIDYVFAFYVYFQWKFLYKIVDFLMHRPKMAIGWGLWEANEGGNVTTVGLRGIQHWGPTASYDIGVAFIGFVGLAVTSQKINDTGFIIGFSLHSIKTVGT